TYVLDLNAGLTQVLDDGVNTYTYGLGRIAQMNTTTEYFLTDALGSVRQMTNHVGEITLVKSYEPYGTNLSSAGDSQTPYGFTGEYIDSTGNIYLRARYYNPNDGRFLSRDTWAGDVNTPLSLNRWMYVEGNPINSVDPSGNAPTPLCLTPSQRIATAKKYMPIGDELNTYAAAGIAVQCFGIYQDMIKNEDANDGQGIGQISENQASTAWGDTIKKPRFGGHG
ncbi:MAG: RHS repeat-associated core domain-containing protein, partial [Anaerolineales bacterium]|nr:RHS repeat-associated core domain-containing protein [Anaerolineales bacterium]